MQIEEIRNIIRISSKYSEQVDGFNFYTDQLTSFTGIILSQIIRERTGSNYQIDIFDVDQGALELDDDRLRIKMDRAFEECREVVALLYDIADLILESDGKGENGCTH